MKNLLLALLLTTLTFSLYAQDSTYTVRVMQYNLLKFGDCDGVTINQKYDWLETVLNAYQPDILVVNEIFPAVPYAAGIVNLSFTFNGNVEYANFTNFGGGSIVNQIFYNADLFGLESNTVLPSTAIRDINIYRLFFKPTLVKPDTTYLNVIAAHLKAGSGASDINARWTAAQDMMNWVTNNAQGENVMVAGDLNIGSASENAFQELVATRSAAVTMVDPLGLQGGWGSSTPAVMTQSPRTFSSDCGVSGGLDDRFDFILPNNAIMNNENGIAYVANSYLAYGNDGDDYNDQLDCGSISVVNGSVCLAIKQLSDHLPVVLELEMKGARLNRGSLYLQLPVWAKFSSQELILDIEGGDPTGYGMEVIDLQGKSLLRSRHEGRGTQRYDVSHFPKGMYVLKITDKQGKQLSRKLVNL
ncbi:MAG: T9SS type A sorting domain-containing protein [Bacteroidota bacterium]